MAKSGKEGRGLFGHKIEFKIGSSASSFRSSSGGVRAPPPPSPSSPRRPPLPPSQLPPPAPAPRIPVAELPWPKGSPPQQHPQLRTLAPAASTSDRVALTATSVDSLGTPPAPAPPGIELVSQSRPKCSPPQSQPVALPQAPPALPSDSAAPTTTNVTTEGVSGLHYKGGNEYEEAAELETSLKHQDTYGIDPESSVSLEFLARAGKRTYPGPPRHQCVECSSALPRKSGPQDGAAAGKKSKRHCCRLAQGINCTVKQFVEKQSLIKEVEIPGTSRDCRISTVSRMSTRLFLRRMIKVLYKLHRSGKCLGGSFNLTNFLLDDDMFIYLDYEEDSLEGYSKDAANRDFKQFVRTVKDEVFAFEEIPQDILSWLSLIERDGRAYEYLISYHSSLMEYHQTLNTFYALYHKLLLMQKRDYAGYIFVLDQLQAFDGWKEGDLHNKFFIDTYVGRNHSTHRQARYGTDVMSLLRLIRNTFQHITLKTMDRNGNVTFGPEEFEYILHDQFPDLLPELMEAMHIAGYLSDLNLEYQMC